MLSTTALEHMSWSSCPEETAYGSSLVFFLTSFLGSAGNHRDPCCKTEGSSTSQLWRSLELGGVPVRPCSQVTRFSHSRYALIVDLFIPWTPALRRAPPAGLAVQSPPSKLPPRSPVTDAVAEGQVFPWGQSECVNNFSVNYQMLTKHQFNCLACGGGEGLRLSKYLARVTPGFPKSKF